MNYDNIVIVDPGMLTTFGHHHTYNRTFGDFFKAGGLQPFFLFNKAMPPEISDEFHPAAATLDCTFYSHPNQNYADRQVFITEAVKFSLSLEKALSRQTAPVIPITKYTLLFAHTFDPLHMAGCALWHKNQSPDKRPFLAMNAMLGIEKDGDGAKLFAPLCYLAKKEPKIRLFGATRSLSATLAQLCGKPCPMLPTPLPDNLPTAKDIRSASNMTVNAANTHSLPRPLFGVMGDARPGKNLHLLPAACALYLQRGNGSILVQLTPTDIKAVGVVEALYDLQVKYPERMSLNIHKQNSTDFYAEMAKLDAMLMPYDPMAYHASRASGPAIEAASLGVPLIALAGGFLEDELKPLDNGSFFMPQADAGALAKVMLLFDKEYPERTGKAQAAAVDYRKVHCLDNIWRLLNFNDNLS
ncbi:MAG: hypothetical protein LBV80_01525 [Deltaproteobacteria bacterium]|jgi:glycosyltransferase involved in cell wall biosynthesis|nr:hypothetical protein [Deltaproteobacteria bacterium]